MGVLMVSNSLYCYVFLVLFLAQCKEYMICWISLIKFSDVLLAFTCPRYIDNILVPFLFFLSVFILKMFFFQNHQELSVFLEEIYLCFHNTLLFVLFYFVFWLSLFITSIKPYFGLVCFSNGLFSVITAL